jgi:hypothetical protein
MEMSGWLIILTGCIYAYIALEQGFKGNFSLMVVYGGYSVSNIGLYWVAK